MGVHEKRMKRCLDLARKGFGKTAPNPMVGCVIVHRNRIIGEGYHEQYGQAHAEVNAVNSVKNKKLLKDSTLYVNLEPCSHFGKTPPCADLIIRMGIKYVVIGTIDPNPKVMGQGLQKLVTAGCDVKVGILEIECRELNKRFFTFFEKGRPYIILKWAQTKDKYIGIKVEVRIKNSTAPKRIQISGHTSQKLVHQWRGEEQAIMVGTNTALCDDPRLTVRKAKGTNPLRILVDRNLKIPASANLLDGAVPTLVFTAKTRSSRKNTEYVKVDFKKDVLAQIMKELHSRKIHSVIVEGGAKLLRSFIQQDLWDEARLFTSNKRLSQIAGNKVKGVETPSIAGRSVLRRNLGSDLLVQLNNTF